jgi:hypothetical protein
VRKFRIEPSEYDGFRLIERVKVFGVFTVDNYLGSGSLGEMEELAKHLCTEPKEISCSQSQ